MISVTELRVSNILHVLRNDVVIEEEVESVGHRGINLSSGYGGCVEPNYEEKDLFGIPLTEEWMVRFGFKKDGFYNSAERWICRYILLFKGNGHFILCDYPLTTIKYVHQLQNLYFALTGSELTING